MAEQSIVKVLNGREVWDEITSRGFSNVLSVYFIASTKISTIPGISLAGVNSELTLYTPALDVEYLTLGKPKSLPIVPTTPDGVPTPALLTRVAIQLSGIPYLVVNCGSYIDPQIPHVDIPGKAVGGRIDVEDSLTPEAVSKLFDGSRTLGKMLGSESSLLVVGESMPGGTTSAMAIMEALGYRAVGRVSSASPSNPHDLKREIFESAVKRVGKRLPLVEPLEVVSHFGDPLHISITGFLAGALERGARVILAGGTQMSAVLALARALGIRFGGRVAIGTTRWIVEDRSSNLLGLVKDIYPDVPVAYADVNFLSVRHRGLRAYEEGYVKEGVGAGGTLIVSALLRNINMEELLKAVQEEYERVVSLAQES
ncbi:MAG: TIGR00303 family protein [Thermoproteota archaeon]|uniref:nicotinate mononucleotide-dependent phosphoribosyltransferase CobT n=1 Tax=Desulfurococcus sp. TaxID=51678 RepID=UPI00316BB2C6